MITNNFTTWNHNTYGGVILSSDYSMHPGTRNIAARIAADLKFDKICKQNVESRDKERKRKNA